MSVGVFMGFLKSMSVCFGVFMVGLLVVFDSFWWFSVVFGGFF